MRASAVLRRYFSTTGVNTNWRTKSHGFSTPTVPACTLGVSNFIVQALLGRDITVYGEGLQTRSFCYVNDLIDGLVRLMSTRAYFDGLLSNQALRDQLEKEPSV
jgi:UDP-glucuronate decarboxylase